MPSGGLSEGRVERKPTHAIETSGRSIISQAGGGERPSRVISWIRRCHTLWQVAAADVGFPGEWYQSVIW